MPAVKSPWFYKVKLLCTLLGVLSPPQSIAEPTQFPSCPTDFFISQGSPDAIRIYRQAVDTSTVNVVQEEITTAEQLDLNAMAFNEPNQFLYALRSSVSTAVPSGDNAHLIKIGSNGEVVDLGEVAPNQTIKQLNDTFYLAGDMAPNGDYYVFSSDRINLIKIRLGQPPNEAIDATTEVLPLSKTIKSGDIAWSNGKFWALHLDATNTEFLVSIDPSNGNVALVGTGIGNSFRFGALWGGPSSIFGNATLGEGFFEFDTSSGLATKRANSIGASRNDAARCTSAPLPSGRNLAASPNSLAQSVATWSSFHLILVMITVLKIVTHHRKQAKRGEST